MANKKSGKITNIELLESINRSFSKIERKMATKEDLKSLETELKKEIEGVKDRLAGTDKRIDNFAETKASKTAHKELENRVGVVEKKLEIKK